MLQARRICSDRVDFEHNVEKIVDKFVQRGYDKQKLVQIGNQVAQMSEDQLYKPKAKNNPQGQLLYISTYDCHSDSIKKAIKKSWHIIKNYRKISKLFPDMPKFVYKRGKM